MPIRRRFKPNLVGLGQVFRLLVVALMLLTAVATLPGQASAKVSPLAGVFAQGASWEAHPQSQKNKNNDDDEEDEDSSSSKNSKNNKDDDEEDDSSSSGKNSKNNNDDDEEDDSSSSGKNSKNNNDDEEDDDSGSSKNNSNNDDEDLPRDWTRNGVISSTEYESPQYGFAVEWADPWVIDDFYDTDDDDTTATVVSDEDTGLDEIRLWSPDASGLLTVQFTPSDGSDASDVQDYWESDEYYEGFTNGAEYLISDGDSESAAVLFLIGDAEDGYIGYNEVTVTDDGDTLIALYLRAPIAEFEDVYADGNDLITVDGNEVFSILRSRDVRNAIKDI